MKVPLRQETNFFALSWAPFGGMNISEGHYYFERFRIQLIRFLRLLVL